MTIKTYYSASIRGEYGEEASDYDIFLNCQRAVERGMIIRNYFDVFVPHEHDPSMREAWRQGLLPIETILALDCAIVERSSILWVDSDPEESEGVQREIECADNEGIEIVLIYDLSNSELDTLCKKLLDSIRR